MELATDQKVQLKSGVVAWRQQASFASQNMLSEDDADRQTDGQLNMACTSKECNNYLKYTSTYSNFLFNTGNMAV